MTTSVLYGPRYGFAQFLFDKHNSYQNKVQHRLSGVLANPPSDSSSRDSVTTKPRRNHYLVVTQAVLLIRRLLFAQLVRKIKKNCMAARRFQLLAIKPLHCAAELNSVKLFEDAVVFVHHAKGTAVCDSYVKLAHCIRYDT